MLIIVTGPPCVGKSTYVATHAGPDDIVIDLDRIALAVAADGTASHDYPEHVRLVARSARNAAADVAVRLHHQGYTAWIIDALPSTQQRAWYHRQSARFVRLTEAPDVLAARAGERPPRNQERIRQLGGPVATASDA